MGRQEILYDINSIVITTTLFLLIVLLSEVGFRIGRFVQSQTDDETRSLTGAVQASVLGLLALLLGFAFNLSMQRFDSRNIALIDEANAIGTAVLRTELLPAQYQESINETFRRYINLRVSVGKIDLTRREERRQYNREIAETQSALWAIATQAALADPRPVTTGSFITSLNQMIDSQGKRQALLQVHVPELVLMLLFIVFAASGGILGYSSGLSGKRIMVPTGLVAFLICLIVFIVIDLDRPKRGLIQVNQSFMVELQEGLVFR